MPALNDAVMPLKLPDVTVGPASFPDVRSVKRTYWPSLKRYIRGPSRVSAASIPVLKEAGIPRHGPAAMEAAGVGPSLGGAGGSGVTGASVGGIGPGLSEATGEPSDDGSALAGGETDMDAPA